mmetsp:Transcript_13273/g.33852  ORF Transcript_13273/g.33852 Transcript_13273/m.33852 type:complete len:250 (+) Transcript_13273:562-1311(+)
MRAALRTSRREERRSAAISARRNWMACSVSMGAPNWRRTCVWSRAASRHACAAPRLQDAMLMRPPSRPAMAILNPAPSSPSRLSSGTRQFSMTTSRVGWQFHPNLRSFLPKLSPGASFGTRMHEMPRGPALPVRHMTAYTSLWPAPLMNAFVPLRTQWSPSRRAVVASDAASDPAPGSVRQYEAKYSMLASLGTSAARTAGLPNESTIQHTMLWMLMYADVLGQAVASASKTRDACMRVRPVPPSSSRV